MENTLVIIDGNSLLNRAYYAIQRPMMTKDGLYTQGIYGFLNMLTKILKDYEPSHIAVAFDRKAPTFRHEEYSEYKAGRKKMPLELAMEFDPLKKVLEAMNIRILEIDGFEADDILGTVSLDAENEGMKTFIVTGDKDSFQLASDKTTIIYTKRGTSEFDAYDRQAVLDRYQLTPDQFIDLKGLMGDSSDNIPGIPGVGEKTATKLLLEYGSVENLIASVDQMKASKLKDKIEENAELAVMSKRLATIIRTVPIEYTFDELLYEEPDYDALIELYRRLEFNSFIKKLSQAGIKMTRETATSAELRSDEAAPADPSSAGTSAAPKTGNGQVISKYASLVKLSKDAAIMDFDSEEALSYFNEKGCLWLHVFHDNNHVEAPAILSVCLAADQKIYQLGWDDAAPAKLKDFFARYTGSICGHGLKKAYYALIRCGAAPEGIERDYYFETAYDTEVAEYLIDPQKKSYELSVIMLERFHEEFPSDKQIAEEAATIDLFGNSLKTQAELAVKILAAASSLVASQAADLDAFDLDRVFTEAELPLIEVLADMEAQGVRADKEALNETGAALKERIDELTTAIYAAAGEEFNINSPKQLGVILFEKLLLEGGKKTKTGYSTSADILEKIADQHIIVPLILEYRMLTKLNGTYVEGMLPLIGSDGRIHAHFQQTVTTTGRLSCTEPNLQNIPVRQELGRQFRKVFTASEEDRMLAGADYSQVELRVMAHLSGDETLKEAFSNNSDIHTITASRVFDKPVEDVTPLERRNAKAVNFGVIYGISAFGLSEDLKISRKEAQQYIDDYFRVHPRVRDYMNSTVEFCREHNYVTTLLGRRRSISEIHASQFMTRQLGERLAMNTPVQGTAADIIKLAMIKTYRALKNSGLESRLILQVHDELIIDTCQADAEKVKDLLEQCMSNAILLDVPLVAEVNTGRSWYDLK